MGDCKETAVTWLVQTASNAFFFSFFRRPFDEPIYFVFFGDSNGVLVDSSRLGHEEPKIPR